MNNTFRVNDQLLEKAYVLINERVREVPICNCHESYRFRNLIDPSCIHCDAMRDDVYIGMVAWRDKFDRFNAGVE